MAFDDATVAMVRDTLVLVLMISLPILIAGMVVGLVISLLQSITSIQDQALTFVPKIVVMVGVAALLIPWIAFRLAEYAAEMLSLKP
jgi:flagellar biosynthetic protein FliQ